MAKANKSMDAAAAVAMAETGELPGWTPMGKDARGWWIVRKAGLELRTKAGGDLVFRVRRAYRGPQIRDLQALQKELGGLLRVDMPHGFVDRFTVQFSIVAA